MDRLKPSEILLRIYVVVFLAYMLLPLIIMLLVLGLLLVFSASSPLAPLLYPLF